MAISGVSSNFMVHQGHTGNQSRQIRMDVKALKTSLARGDLSGAQIAFNTLTQDAATITKRSEQSYPAPHGHDNGNAISSNAFVEFALLDNALRTSDLAGAQEAFASMMQELGESPQSRRSAKGLHIDDTESPESDRNSW